MDVIDTNFDILYFVDSTLVFDYVWLPSFELDLMLPNGIICLRGFDIDYSNISTLPKNLKVGGTCSLESTKVTHLPQCIKVDGNLVLSGSKVKLPLKVRGDIIQRY